MHKMSSNTILSVIKSYTLFQYKSAAQEDQDHKRYLSLAEFLEIPLDESSTQDRQAAEESDREQRKEIDTELEKQKQKRLTGQKGISEAFARAFKELIVDYLPGGFFTWEEYARNIANNFYRMAYAQFHNILPKMLVEKLKDSGIDASVSDISFDSETMNKIITDALIYFNEHPEEIKDGLIRAFSKREREEERGVGMAQVFFIPRIDASTFNEIKKRSDAEGEELSLKVGDTDTSVLDALENLKGRKDIKWKWKEIDKNGILHFNILNIPEISGSRDFFVKLPKDIQYIKPGEYTFRIKDVTKKGAVLEFVEQKKDIHNRTMPEIKETGLDENQFRSLVNNGFISRFTSVLRAQPMEKLIEDFLGKFTLGSSEISDVEDLKELAEYGEKDKTVSETRGEKEVKEEHQKALEEKENKIKAVIQAWTPTLAKYFLKFTEDEGQRISRVVAEQFPEQPEKLVPGIETIMATRPVVEMVLNFIMSPQMPLGGKGVSNPWIHIAWDAFKKMAIQDPNVRAGFEKNVRAKRKDKELNQPVSDAEIVAILNKLKNMNKAFVELKKRIADTIEKMKNAPELQKFFERKRNFRAYMSRYLEDETEEFIEAERLEFNNPKDLKRIEIFVNGLINKTVKRMSKTSSEVISHLIHFLINRVKV